MHTLVRNFGLSVALLTVPGVAAAQNLLTVNPSFESGGLPIYVNPGQTASTQIPGFLAVTSSTGFAGVDSNQPNTAGRDGSFFGYLNGTGAGGPSSVTTAPVNRGAATAGQTYTFRGLVLNDIGTSTGATARINFYDGNLASSTLLASVPLTNIAPANVPAGAPRTFLPFSFDGAAPAGTTYAGVSFSTVSQHVFDNFSLTPVPEPATVGLVSVLGLAALRYRRRLA